MTDDEEYLSWVFHYTWQAVCKSPLGRNLAVAGALCAAFRDGWNCRFIIGPNGVRTPWQPGCGREVPR